MFRKGFIVLAAIWIALPASSLTAFGQEGNGLAIDVVSVDSSRFPSLSVVVNVLDDKGRPVPGLTSSSFGATLDSRPVTVDGLQSVVDSQVSLSVVLAVDASGSMAGAPLSAAQSAATEFVNGLSAQDSVAVIAFSDAVTVVQEPTTDKALAANALQNLTASGNTALFEATSRATAKALESSSPRRVIILLSDGVDYGDKSTVSRDDSIAQARAGGVPVYTIALGAEVDKGYLSELAQATGAGFLETPSPEGLSQLYADIGAVLRGQYVVSLQPPALDANVSHALEISVSSGGVTATASRSLDAVAPGQSPQVTIQGLRAGDSVGSALTVTAQVTGGTPTGVRFLVDGTEMGVATVSPYQMTLDPAALAQGDHTLRVEATDANGLLASSETAFAASPPATGGASKTPFLIALMAVTAGIGAVYVLQRRRPRVGRKVVEVRLKPWSNNAAVVGGMSLLDEPIPPPEPEPVEEPVGKLILVDGPDAGKEYTVGMSPLSIGSARWCEITFPDDDDSIGPEEARAWVHQDKLIFHKLTRLSLLASEGALGGWLILENGDEVSVGRFRLQFVSLAPVTAQQDNVNKAVHEAVEHLSGRNSNTGLASRLWPAEEPHAKPAWLEDSRGPVPSAPPPSDEPPVKQAEPVHDSSEAGSSRFWPADRSLIHAIREEDQQPPSSEVEEMRVETGEPDVPQPELPRLWPVDDVPLELRQGESTGDHDLIDLWPADEQQPPDDDLDRPAAASSG